LSSVAYDGIEYVITNYVYEKTSAPAVADFTANVAFDFGTGYSSGYTKSWEYASKSTTKGTVSQPSDAAATSNTKWTFGATGNKLSTDSKILESLMSFEETLGSAADAKA